MRSLLLAAEQTAQHAATLLRGPAGIVGRAFVTGGGALPALAIGRLRLAEHLLDRVFDDLDADVLGDLDLDLAVA